MLVGVGARLQEAVPGCYNTAASRDQESMMDRSRAGRACMSLSVWVSLRWQGWSAISTTAFQGWNFA